MLSLLRMVDLSLIFQFVIVLNICQKTNAHLVPELSYVKNLIYALLYISLFLFFLDCPEIGCEIEWEDSNVMSAMFYSSS